MIPSPTVPDFVPTEPVPCGCPRAPWLPLCDHAGRRRAGDLTRADVGRVVTTREATGVLVDFRLLGDGFAQLLLLGGRDGGAVTHTPAGEVVRIGRPPP